MDPWETPLEGAEEIFVIADQQLGVAAQFSLLGESDSSLDAFFAIDMEVLDYIAGDDELDPLREASAAERRQLWRAFWTRRDPTPQTEHNEFKEEFFRRVNFANETFGTVHAGWRTDRGRTYIVHGEPDQITQGIHPLYQQAMEIWRYSGLGTEFVFVDRGGFGEFQLIESGW